MCTELQLTVLSVFELNHSTYIKVQVSDYQFFNDGNIYILELIYNYYWWYSYLDTT